MIYWRIGLLDSLYLLPERVKYKLKSIFFVKLLSKQHRVNGRMEVDCSKCYAAKKYKPQ